jgi:hypothetical protein
VATLESAGAADRAEQAQLIRRPYADTEGELGVRVAFRAAAALAEIPA